MHETALDTLHRVETPEGIELHADLAGPLPRALAYAIDLVLRGVVLSVLWIVLLFTLGEGAGTGVMLVLSFLLEWFYPVFFEVLRGGQTPGKRMFRLAVVNHDLTPVRLDASLVRNLLRTVDFLPFAYLGGLLCMAGSARFQRLGDMAAGTMVVHRPEVAVAAALPDCRPVAPSEPLTAEEQLAIIEFTQRHGQLSPSRQEELANILRDLTGAEGERGVSRVRAMGAWLLGGR